MHKIKIAHESPLSIFDKVQSLTDYDYALVHLFEENEDYYNKFKLALQEGREVILDNSIFELGEAFDTDKYRTWIKKLQPTWYIIPDSLENRNKTMANIRDWDFRIPGKSIGVVQGKSYEEIVGCYRFIKDKVDMIAISFDYSYFEKEFPIPLFGKNKYYSYMMGRINLLKKLQVDNIIDKSKPHHLLGCGLPQEFLHYRTWEWIYSIDTSNPVVHGIKNIKYKDFGLDNKESVKLFTLIEDEVTSKWEDINYNILVFRHFCNGAGLVNVDKSNKSDRK